MTLRTQVIVYLVALHLVFAALALLIFRASPYWLIGLEPGFLVSLATGVHLARRGLQAAGLSAEAMRLVREQELTSRLRETGDPDADALIALYNGIVDSLRAERVRVQEQQHFFSQVIGASPTGIVILDLDGRVSEINPAGERLLGVVRAGAVGQRPDRLASVLAPHLAALESGAGEVVSLAGPRRVRCQRGRFMDRGFPRDFFVVEELTDELRQFERNAYEKLIRVMSHEVNNTVAAANSLLHSSLIYARELPDASRMDVEEAIGIVIDRTEALSTFMKRFADVFRLPAPMPRPVIIQDVVEPLVTLLRARPESTAMAWTLELPAVPRLVELDSEQFEQALLNILKNAAEAAGPTGHVTVRVRDDGPLQLEIEDDGPGFSPEVHEHLFTPFFSTKANGQGIGLTLVQEILNGHDFDYRFERTADRTRFLIRLS